jgi:hypothetical protein
MKPKKILGGYISNPIKQVEVFISLIILGYFGVKIIYGIFFKFYPQKYYYRNIEINSESNNLIDIKKEKELFNFIKEVAEIPSIKQKIDNKSITIPQSISENSSNENVQKLVLNAYMPGMWNNEITDFVITIILSFIIFIYTSLPNRSMISEEGNLNPALLFGFVLGLGYPPINQTISPLINNLSNSSIGRNIFNCFGGLIFIFLVLFIIVSNFSVINNSSNSSINYLTYICTIILVIFGLYISRKQGDTINSISYFSSNAGNCTTKTNNFVKSSGERLNISATFVVFILLLLFSFSPSDPSYNYAYIFIYGLFLGIFVSGMSYYGIEYFLIKQPEKSCNSLAECNSVPQVINDNSLNDTSSNDIVNNYKYDNNSISVIKLMLVICLLVILVYLGYKYISK